MKLVLISKGGYPAKWSFQHRGANQLLGFVNKFQQQRHYATIIDLHNLEF